MKSEEIHLVGGGLVGSLAAIFLAQRGHRATIHERRPDMRSTEIPAGRSINLAVTSRGLLALEQVGLKQAVLDIAVPMRGRMLHQANGETEFLPYGQREDEVIYSVSRGALNKLLLATAGDYEWIDLHFNQRCTSFCVPENSLTFFNELGHHETRVAPRVVLATDGVNSVVRRGMLKHLRLFDYSQTNLEHGYKELEIPATSDGEFALDRNALHIWPRRSFMLIALPNFDGSFTCTLFLPFEGPVSFAALDTREKVMTFFKKHFPDAAALMWDLAADFEANPTGSMVTIKCLPWHVADRAMLLGDAAHAIVPFFGQGMNCGFEDCTALGRLLDAHGPEWEVVFSKLQAERKPNADAIADMAIENFVEMRDTVIDPKFQLKKEIGFQLERKHPCKFIPHYSMVVFHPEIPYAEARQRSIAQDGLLNRLATGIDSLQDVNWAEADKLVREL